MKHECTHAYEMQGVNYLLCDREARPSPNDMQAVSHATCPHQRFCVAKRCSVLLPVWKDCFKNKLDTNTAGVMAAKAKSKSGSKKKSAAKPAEE